MGGTEMIATKTFEVEQQQKRVIHADDLMTGCNKSFYFLVRGMSDSMYKEKANKANGSALISQNTEQKSEIM